jgi:SAM-dependent methyltransferase
MTSPLAADPSEPFDRSAWRRQRARVRPGHDFLDRALAADLAARIDTAGRRFAVAVDYGGSGVAGDDLTVMVGSVAGPGVALVADADRLPLADASVDLIAALGLHAVGDLPGALILARRALRPGGLFVAALVGGTTLAEVRADLLAAEVALTGRAAARVLPMVDPQAAPGLLQRAGFADPVAEVDTLTVRYDDLAGCLRDLRGAGAGNILRGREPLRRDVLADAARRFAERAVAGRIAVTVQVIYLTGRGR